MKTSDAVRMFLLGAAVALLAVIAFRPGEQSAQAQMAGAPAGNLIALTGAGPREQASLYLIDPAKQTLAFYTAKDNAPFSLRGVRWFKDDLSIFYTGDKDPFNNGGISTKEAEALAKKHGGK